MVVCFCYDEQRFINAMYHILQRTGNNSNSVKYQPNLCLLIPDSKKYLKSKFGIRNTFFENNVTNPAYVSSR